MLAPAAAACAVARRMRAESPSNATAAGTAVATCLTAVATERPCRAAAASAAFSSHPNSTAETAMMAVRRSTDGRPRIALLGMCDANFGLAALPSDPRVGYRLRGWLMRSAWVPNVSLPLPCFGSLQWHHLR